MLSVRAQLSQLKQNRRNAASCRLRLGQLMPGPFPAAAWPAPRQPALRLLTTGQLTTGQLTTGLLTTGQPMGQPAVAQLRLGTAAGRAPV